MTATELGTLYVVATPIGNLEDITLRALRVLGEVDFVVAEDSRHTRRLLDHHQIATPFASSHYQGVERERVAKVLALLRAGWDLALVSNAGTPLLSDPGYPLVRAALAASIEVIPIPGPSALLSALVKSGLPMDRFAFDGVPPKKAQARHAYFESLAREPRTVALYESRHRIEKTLETLAQVLPDRELVLCRELTKLYEEALRGTAETLLQALAQRPAVKGEFVLMIQGADLARPQAAPEGHLLADQVEGRIAHGEDRKTAIKAVAKVYGLPKRAVFDAVERAKRGG